MDRELAKELKLAGFTIGAYQAGHKFYPHESDSGWSDAARRHGVIINTYTLEDRFQDINNGYYCPGLSELIGACGNSFSRLSILKARWIAESVNPEQAAIGDSPEEAVGRLWLALHKLKPSANRPPVQS